MEKNKRLLIISFMCLIILTIIVSFSMIFASCSYGETQIGEFTNEDDSKLSVNPKAMTRTDRSELVQNLGQNRTDSSCGINYSSSEVPVYERDGYQIFCIEKGGAIKGPAGIKPGDITGGSFHFPSGQPCEDQQDTPNYKCVGEADLNLTAAYSLSAKRGNWKFVKWSSDHITDQDLGILQDALWADDINVMQSGKEEFRNKISDTTGYALWEEALKYQNFYNQMQQTGGYNPKDTTQKDKVDKIVNQEEKNYIVGPFSVDYLKEYVDSVDGSRVNFGVIKKIGLVDQDNNEIDDVKIIMQDNQDNSYDFPNPNQKFYVKFNADKYPNARKVKVKIDFEYLENCTGRYHMIEGYGDEIGYRLESKNVDNHCYTVNVWTDEDGIRHTTRHYQECVYYYYKSQVVGQYKAQNLMGVHINDKSDDSVEDKDKYDAYAAKRAIKEKTVYLDNENGSLYDLTMNIGGFAYLDNSTGKAGTANGLKDDGDKALKHTIVTLYDQDGKVVTDLYNDGKPEDIKTNPTITDENGYYEFGKLNSMKKYFVKFTYNGQIYASSTYLNGKYDSVNAMVQAGQYNTELWAQTSKGNESTKGRASFNNEFAEIGSYPNSYASSNSLGYGIKGNIAYQYEDIAEVYDTIDAILLDGIKNVHDWLDLKNIVYPMIIESSKDPQIKNKLQFIEDCKIDAYTSGNGNERQHYYTYSSQISIPVLVSKDIDLYPVYNKFVIGNNKATISRLYNSDQGTYPPIYPGQLQVNYGVIYRPTLDLALYKDVMLATTKINGKSETYYYDKRALLGKKFRFGIPVENDFELTNEEMEEKHLSNITENAKPNYDETAQRESYTQYVRKEDISQSGNGNTATAVYNLSEEDKLNVFIKYKIAIKNQSSTVGEVTELVDYYNANFTPSEVYVGNIKGDNLGIDGISVSNTSKYGSEITPTEGYNPMYISMPNTSSVRMSDGETLYVYVTLKMNNPSELLASKGLLDGKDYESYNYVEINGYRSFYEKNGEGSPGLIDIDSIAGNFDIKNYKPGETLLEDDEDTAPVVIFKAYEERSLDGNVFEDIVTSVNSKDLNSVFTGKYRTADGKYKNDKPIAGVRVELVEIKNGNMQVRAYTYTDDKGYYKFDSFIPGEYVVRYVYGEEDKTALTNESENYKGLNEKSYNGQDFQSTVAKNRGNETASYNDPTFGKQTVVNTYGEFPFYWYGNDEERNSDATDISLRRDEVNNYSKVIKNHISKVLSSYEYKNVDRNLVNELEKNTFMIALTPEMSIEPEIMKNELSYDGDKQKDENYKYKITNVDFGIVERPRAELVVKKVVDKVSLIASDGSILAKGYIDENNKVVVTDGSLKWVSNLMSVNNKGIVSIEADQELVHGATLTVSYKIIVTNKSEYDTYKGNVVTGKVNRVVDYIANNFTFDPDLNKGWTLVKASDLQLDDDRLTWVDNSLSQEDRSKKAIDLSGYQNIAVSNNDNEIYNKELAPGESISTGMVLKKLISTTEDDTDDFVYLNDLEAIESSMSNGRKYYRGISGNYDPVDRVSVKPYITDNDGKNPIPPTPIKDSPVDPPVEPDTSTSEKVIITPPTGGTFSNAKYIIIAILGLGAIVATVIILKKKCKKNNEKKTSEK